MLLLLTRFAMVPKEQKENRGHKDTDYYYHFHYFSPFLEIM